MLKDTEQTLRKYKIATFNRSLHENQICPGNHEVNYYNSWYYFDGKPKQRPDITRKAQEHFESVETKVAYSQTYNTYVLTDNY